MIKKYVSLVVMLSCLCLLLCQCTGRTVARALPPFSRVAVIDLLGQDIQIVHDTRDLGAKKPQWSFHQQKVTSFNPQQLSTNAVVEALTKAGYEPIVLGAATAGLGPVVSMTETGLPEPILNLVQALTRNEHFDKVLLILPKTVAIYNIGEVEGFGALCHGGSHYPAYGGYIMYLYDAPRNNVIARLGDSFVTDLPNTATSVCQTHKQQLTSQQLTPIENELSLFLRRSLATKVTDIVRGVS